MSEAGRALRAAYKGLVYEFRCYLCELFILWGLKVIPEGYIPSFIQSVIDERKKSDERVGQVVPKAAGRGGPDNSRFIQQGNRERAWPFDGNRKDSCE